jgi:hypothetical protein
MAASCSPTDYGKSLRNIAIRFRTPRPEAWSAIVLESFGQPSGVLHGVA